VSDPLAAGIHAMSMPGLAGGFAAVEGAHRFFYNPRVTLPRLIEPAHHCALEWREQAQTTWALIVHDWSALTYRHRRKTDQTRLTHSRTRGYELTALLLVEGHGGDPIAPLELRMRTAKGVFSTRTPAPGRKAFRIDEVLPSMRAVARLGLGGPMVHIIDREADSLARYRDWQAAGHHFLVRAKGNRKVLWRGEELSIMELAERLPLRRCREVQYQGQTAVPRIAEAEVVLHRPAWRHRRRHGQVINERVPGPPLTLRLIVSRVCDGTGRTLAVWYLLTNVPGAVNTATVALWYYWRWRIESLFKLLKSAGHQAEHWLQQSGEAIAKRLLVAAMACMLVWRIQHDTRPEAGTLRELLVRLSGRQMKWGQEHTVPALLAGLWTFLGMMEVLREHRVTDLHRLNRILFERKEEDSG
jgi:hypothetical protein